MLKISTILSMFEKEAEKEVPGLDFNTLDECEFMISKPVAMISGEEIRFIYGRFRHPRLIGNYVIVSRVVTESGLSNDYTRILETFERLHLVDQMYNQAPWIPQLAVVRYMNLTFKSMNRDLEILRRNKHLKGIKDRCDELGIGLQ